MASSHASTTQKNSTRSSSSRRKFLQQAGSVATVAVGSSLLPTAAIAAATDSTKKVRIGIVGGRFGRSFQWHQHPQCQVTGVSDLRPERREGLKQTYSCDQAYDSLEIMLKQARDIDAVGIYTEAPNHVRHSVAALKAGKHVICAVPAAMTLAECQLLVDTVKETGLTFMMAETSHWQQHTISARKLFQAGEFGNLYSTYSMYHHPGLETLWFEGGKPTWRHGFPPMNYPTHCTAHLISVSGERLVEVSCLGWGDDSKMLAGNPYDNPFWNESAQFKTDRGNAFRVEVWWAGAVGGGERAEWFGDKRSLLCATPYGKGPTLVRAGKSAELDSGGFSRARAQIEPYDIPDWWATDMLPKELRHNSGHHGSHTFITHEFIHSLVTGTQPAVDVYEAVAYTAPGIVAHQSALKGGELMKIPNFG
jgi:predicted dehydrogenase